MGVKRMLYERIVISIVVYGAMTWYLTAREKRRPNVMEMKGLREKVVKGNSHG